MRAIIGLITLLLFLFVLPLVNSTLAANLLLNSSFEDPASGSPTSWTKSVSTATLSTSATAKTGTSSASINKTNSATGLIYLYQDVDVEPDAFYSISGYAIKNSANFSWVILRISWRSSSAEISKTDSSQLTSDSSDFQLLNIDSTQAPSQAIKARVELAANITTVNPGNPALFDDINFSQIPAPDQPTPTSVPTPTPSPTPTPTKTPTSTPKPNTPTPKISIGEILPTGVLGESTESAEIISPTNTLNKKVLVSNKTKENNSNWFQKISMLVGVVFVAICGILIFREIRKNKLIENE